MVFAAKIWKSGNGRETSIDGYKSVNQNVPEIAKMGVTKPAVNTYLFKSTIKGYILCRVKAVL